MGPLQEVLDYLSNEVELIIHCGDWVSPFVLPLFKNAGLPVWGVFGNNDGDKFRHLLVKEREELDLQIEDRFIARKIEDRLIAVFHGDYIEIVEALVTCGKYDAVFHGHAHKQVNEHIGHTLSLNPGTLLSYHAEHSFAVYDSHTNCAEHHY